LNFVFNLTLNLFNESRDDIVVVVMVIVLLKELINNHNYSYIKAFILFFSFFYDNLKNSSIFFFENFKILNPKHLNLISLLNFNKLFRVSVYLNGHLRVI